MDTSEQHRHRCEVRQVLRWRVEHGIEWVRLWMHGRPESPGKKRVFGVVDFRGQAATARLQEDCRAQWAAGSRGADGDWR